MGVNHRLILTKGWKAKERGRYGKCVVIQFYDEKTGKDLFDFAPKLLDIPEFEDYFRIMKEYDYKMRIRRMLENETEKIKEN